MEKQEAKMWDPLSSLAQKAKDAAARIESEINNSVGYVDSMSTLFSEAKAAPLADDGNENEYFKVEEEEVSFSEADPSGKGGENTTRVMSNPKDSEGSGGWDQCEDANSENNSITTLPEAMAKIEALKEEIKSVKEELVAAKDDAKSYRVINLELEQQVRDLTEENMSLKMAAKDTD